ncbi:Deoxyribodipyrimidine photo-lyase [Roseivivax sp. THAF40]|uniref:FAD-binding domain-containing protein n=1 Tax=unclassified Roseivivax TaxID=2639302 RepID=UPI001269358E|nr:MULTISPECIES: FAD-binding domain-containing protein [unclassified Roseivivax]QFS83822.1 Deoxyribodipyrimidine photo-lyase [Roseivivax sp. THAF197b]QFT47654.1 Deoxyribodipyrimidine photo-lyase [Roseivivax sp. THAF40]
MSTERALNTFPPSREAALDRLQAFVPNAARDYTTRRNYDLGPGAHDNVSMLSAYLRHRVLTEEEVLQAVLARHSRTEAEKFIQEVFWRTYFKGWLEMRPPVWGGYRSELSFAWDQVQTQSGLRRAWEDACNGETGIECFDAWARELVETGYLHNHARMWFASIWIFTLNLPWALGADFFLRHLCDGDPASNTLGWRWVAGLQTPGKTYQARASNIRKYTNERFHPKWQLAGECLPVQGAENPPRMEAPTGDSFDPSKKTAFLLHDDDLSPDWLLERGLEPVATATLDVTERLSILTPAAHVGALKSSLMRDCVTRHEGQMGVVTEGLREAQAIVDWAREAGAEQIVTSYAPVGPVADLLHEVHGLPVLRPLRPYDQRAWPHATAGFFKFKDKIPALLGEMRGLRAA